MAFQSTIDRINDAIIALGKQKELLMIGNAVRPDSRDVLEVRGRMQIVCRALDAICQEYDVMDSYFADVPGDTGFQRAAERADERLYEPRGLRCLIDEDYDR